VEKIRQRLMVFATWNSNVVGINTMRWLLGQTVAVEDVLREAEQHFPRAREFYQIKCRYEMNKKQQ
jgi:hypothetical protein